MLMAAVAVLLFIQGHPISHTRETVPFLPGRSAVPGGMTIRMEGNIVKSGVYQFDGNVPLGTVINMTVPFLRGFSWNQSWRNKILSTGDVVSMSRVDAEHIEITRNNMCVVQKMILGIPLDPNNLTSAEWELLPRIGPTLARRIILDRQKNGDYRSIRDLDRVPGIGAATLQQLKGYLSTM